MVQVFYSVEKMSETINRNLLDFWASCLTETRTQWRVSVCSDSTGNLEVANFCSNFIDLASELQFESSVGDLEEWEKEVVSKIQTIFEEQLVLLTKQKLAGSRGKLYSKLREEFRTLRDQYHDFEFEDLVSLGLDAESLIDSDGFYSIIEDKIKIAVR